jgi:hypothetical protein
MLGQLSFWGGSLTQILLRDFDHFGGPPNPTIIIVIGPNTSFTVREFVLLGRLPNSSFTPWAFDHLGGPLEPLGFQRPKIKFYGVGICPFG